MYHFHLTVTKSDIYHIISCLTQTINENKQKLIKAKNETQAICLEEAIEVDEIKLHLYETTLTIKKSSVLKNGLDQLNRNLLKQIIKGDFKNTNKNKAEADFLKEVLFA